MGKVGKVWLVGAGPGDPGLFTQRGKGVLSRADVILYDRLVNPGILMWAREGAKFVDAGKTPGGKKMEQGEIHRLLVKHAKFGEKVVRLKGGDPFVFGRGGEEAEILAKAKIPFEVVPGVTAGIAGPGYAGIPVTQRGMSTEADFRIGSRAEGSVSGKTLVGYMSVDRLEDFLSKAMDQGFNRKTPAALIESGTCCNQRVLVGTVGTLARAAKKARMRAPAIVVVGAVVSLRKKLAWSESRPLAGKRIILTASESLRKGWREEIESLGAEVWEIPMTRTIALPPQKSWKEKIKNADWLVFTSAAGVRAFPGVVWDWRKISHCQIAAVGKSTAEVLRSIGLQPDWIGGGPGSRELVKGWPRWAKGKILHLTGDAGSGEMVELFRKKGFFAERLVIYQNSGTGPIPQPVRIALSKSGADWVVFASGTAAERFRKAVPNWSREPKVVVIGPATARAARQAGWRVRAIAHEPSAARILDAILHRS